MPDLISVVVTTFDREDALAAVLRGLDRQGDRDFEIIVADDGSAPSTARLVEEWGARNDVPVRHVWQAHAGFRAGEIRNRAIAESRGALCVFLDGDCIPHGGFIAAHRRLAEAGHFVTGNRVLLSRALTESILRDGLMPETWPWHAWARHRLRGDINRVAPFLSLPLGPLRKIEARRWRGARSCNLAVWKKDLLMIDGFDTQFSGWGLEDSDLILRLIHAGVRRKDGRLATGVLHLWHQPADRSAFTGNQQRLDEVIASRRVRAVRGLSALGIPQVVEAG